MSTVSDVDICNLALSMVGGPAGATVERLTSLTATDDASANVALGYCQAFYPMVCELIVTELKGPRTKKYLDPGSAVSTASTEENPGWNYAFTRPASLISIVSVVDPDSHKAHGEAIRYPYEEVDGQILCDYSDILIEAIVNETDTTKWPMHVVYAAATRLASMLAVPMGMAEKQESLIRQADMAKSIARMELGDQKYVEEAEPDYVPQDAESQDEYESIDYNTYW